MARKPKVAIPTPQKAAKLRLCASSTVRSEDTVHDITRNSGFLSATAEMRRKVHFLKNSAGERQKAGRKRYAVSTEREMKLAVREISVLVADSPGGNVLKGRSRGGKHDLFLRLRLCRNVSEKFPAITRAASFRSCPATMVAVTRLNQKERQTALNTLEVPLLGTGSGILARAQRKCALRELHVRFFKKIELRTV